MSTIVHIEGQPVTIHEFSAFKGVYATEIIAEVETVVRELTDEAAEFRANYARKHSLNMSRAEARRQFRPQPLYRREEHGDDGVAAVPVLNDAGEPVMGPDPLGHLTDADWEASNNELRIPEMPTEEAILFAMLPKAFKLARTHVMRLLALAIATNREIEEWAGVEIDQQLDASGAKLLHKCSLRELIGLAVQVMRIVRDEAAGPFEEARREVQQMFTRPTTSPTEQAPEPMRMETVDEPAETPSSPTSSTESPDATAGTQSPSSTAPAGA